MDIKPPSNPKKPKTTPSSDLPTMDEPTATEEKPLKKSHKKTIIFIILGIVVALIGVIIAAIVWYQQNLRPLGGEDMKKRIVIEQGSGAEDIANLLEKEKIIRNSQAFTIYLKLSDQKSKLQAGTYLLSPTQSSSEIARILTSGDTAKFQITILPGKSVAEIKEKLVKDGFSTKEVEAAFAKKYDHPLFVGKPAEVGLEGYIYPETYTIDAATSVETLLNRTFSEFYNRLQEKHLIEQLQQQKLSLFQGMTLASMVELEVPHAEEESKVAQVFLKRLSINMPLGSDVTFLYAAKQLGVAPSPEVDSPYNTRKYPGLPPSPISNFNIRALEAMAKPAATDYLFFVAGDDGVTHFTHTEEEHQKAVDKYCTRLCKIVY